MDDPSDGPSPLPDDHSDGPSPLSDDPSDGPSPLSDDPSDPGPSSLSGYDFLLLDDPFDRPSTPLDDPQDCNLLCSKRPCSRPSTAINLASRDIDLVTLEEQLFDSFLLRLWRTGADDEIYCSNEDEDVDVSYRVKMHDCVDTM